jgi:hypothetical protein
MDSQNIALNWLHFKSPIVGQMDIKVRANFVEIFLHVVQHVYGEK